MQMVVGTLRRSTVTLISKLMNPLVDVGVITNSERHLILGNLRHLADKGELLPPIEPKLLDRVEAATMLSVSLSNFKKLEREGAFPFSKKMVGSSVRYRNLDILRYMVMDDQTETEEEIEK